MTTAKHKSRLFTLRGVRVNFPRLFKPEVNNLSGEEEYSVRVILDPNDDKCKEYIKEIDDARRELAEANWGERWQTLYRENKDSKNTMFLRQDYERGYFFINLKRKKRDGAPKVVWRHGHDDLHEEDGKPLAGDYCNVMFEMWTYKTPQNATGWSGTLMGVQFVKRGEPLGGARTAKPEDFDTLPDEEEDDLTAML